MLYVQSVAVSCNHVLGSQAVTAPSPLPSLPWTWVFLTQLKQQLVPGMHGYQGGSLFGDQGDTKSRVKTKGQETRMGLLAQKSIFPKHPKWFRDITRNQSRVFCGKNYQKNSSLPSEMNVQTLCMDLNQVMSGHRYTVISTEWNLAKFVWMTKVVYLRKQGHFPLSFKNGIFYCRHSARLTQK